MAISAGAEKVLVASATGSAVSSIDITSGIDSTYDEYELHFIGITVSVDTVNMFVYFSTDGLVVPTYVSAGGGTSVATSYTANEGNRFYTFPAAGGYLLLTHSTNSAYRPGNAAGESISGICKFYNPVSTSVKRTFQNVHVFTCSNGNIKVYAGSSAADSVAAAIDSLRITPASGTISGELRLYGISKSV